MKTINLWLAKDIDGNWFKNIPKGATTGKHNGFTMLVDIEAFDYNYSDEGAEGLKVRVLSWIDNLDVH